MIYIVSYLYLVLPLVIFCIGWLKVPVAFIAVCVLASGLVLVTKHYATFGRIHLTPFETGAILTTAFIFTYLSGAGESVSPNMDWIKHDAVLNDLMSFRWPFGYTYPHVYEPVTISYYLGWYMIPAIAGKIGGISIAVLFQFLYTYFGLYLILVFISILARHHRKMVFICLVLTGSISVAVTPLGEHIHIINLAYFPHLGSLQLVPNQTIPVIMLSCILLIDLLEKRNHIMSLIWFSTGLFWAPLALVGTIPLILLHLVRVRSLSWIHFEAIGYFAVLTGFMYLWYKPNLFRIHHSHLFANIFVPQTPSEIVQVFIFLMVQIALPISLVRAFGSHLQAELKQSFFVMILFLMALPFIHYGVFNDLVTRGSIAGVFIVSVVTTYLILGARKLSHPRHILLMLIMGYFMYMNIPRLDKSNRYFSGVIKGHVTEFESSDVLTQQYLGYLNSFFSRRLMKEVGYIHHTKRE